MPRLPRIFLAAFSLLIFAAWPSCLDEIMGTKTEPSSAASTLVFMVSGDGVEIQVPEGLRAIFRAAMKPGSNTPEVKSLTNSIEKIFPEECHSFAFIPGSGPEAEIHFIDGVEPSNGYRILMRALRHVLPEHFKEACSPLGTSPSKCDKDLVKARETFFSCAGLSIKGPWKGELPIPSLNSICEESREPSLGCLAVSGSATEECPQWAVEEKRVCVTAGIDSYCSCISSIMIH